MLIYSVTVTALLAICIVMLILVSNNTQDKENDKLDLKHIILGDFYNRKDNIDNYKKSFKSKTFIINIFNNSPEYLNPKTFNSNLKSCFSNDVFFEIISQEKSLVGIISFDCPEKEIIDDLTEFTNKNPSIYIGVSPSIDKEGLEKAFYIYENNIGNCSGTWSFISYCGFARKAREIGMFNKKQISRFDVGEQNKLQTFPVEYETALLNYFDTGNIESATEIIQASYENAENYAQCMYISNHLLHILHTVLAKNNITIEEVYGDNVNLYRWSASTTKKNNEIQHIIKWYSQAMIYIEEHSDKTNQIEYKIEKYIEENYSKDISITTMAEEFQISSQYFSRYFKSQTGNNFLETLNKYRIKKAVELLNVEDLTMNEVAAMTGFNNYKSFARNFKKYTGKIPSKYNKKV